MNVLPIFSSHYSIGRSVLTLDSAEEINNRNPISIFSIAKKHNLNEIVLVDNSISGFLEAYQNSKKNNIKLIFGLKLNVIADVSNKTEESLKTVHKVIVMMNNTNGYYDLIKISSFASTNGFYYKPNIDCNNLSRMWTSNLQLLIPFYDSFLFKNCLEGYLCVPNFNFTKPIFLIENSGLPFDKAVQKRVIDCANNIKADVFPSRSIYYYKKENFEEYLVFRCIHDRTTIQKPQLEHFSSDNFCFESWEEQNELNNVLMQ